MTLTKFKLKISHNASEASYEMETELLEIDRIINTQYSTENYDNRGFSQIPNPTDATWHVDKRITDKYFRIINQLG